MIVFATSRAKCWKEWIFSIQLISFILVRETINLVFVFVLIDSYSTDLKLENVLFVHRTLETVSVDHRGKNYNVSVPVNRRIKRMEIILLIGHVIDLDTC